ncbi:hypothetical protein DdX_00211 [Ditylenchus destructor]|uniref:Lipid-binding serum glycoprotein N-terminal domain-containing protein n=1 Tax=Ditylenchus destructor TaxID=166010 RepID=A0AAD4RD40_9BILA|nr:hypothetical protein DdX_00211 [Ditylenchus destructor]
MITSASSCALKLLVPLLLLLVDMKYTISQDDVDLVPIGSALLPPRSPSLSPTQNPPLTQPFNDERFKQRHNGPRTTTVTPEPNAINKTNSANTTDIAKLLKSKKEQEPYVGIRIRFNEPFFEETARLFYTVFSNQVKNIKIIPQRQCFQEGCFNLHSFLITGFQRPRGITLRPLAPNLLLLNIFSFDVDIKGLLHGNILLLLTAVPVSGRIDVGSRQLSITAAFDLQKNAQRVPYLRMQSCELRTGFVTTHVSELGLLTDSINLKYKADMVTKAKEMITTTICNQIEHLIKSQVNDRLRQMPRSISIAQIFSVLMNNDECKSVPVVACDDATGQKAKPAFEYSKQPIVPKTYDGFSAQSKAHSISKLVKQFCDNLQS